MVLVIDRIWTEKEIEQMNPTNSQIEQLTNFDDLVISRRKGQRDANGRVKSLVDVASLQVPTPYHCRDGSGTDDAGKATAYAIEEFLWSQGCKSPSRALYNTTKAELDKQRVAARFRYEAEALAVEKAQAWQRYAAALERQIERTGGKISKQTLAEHPQLREVTTYQDSKEKGDHHAPQN